MRPSRFARPLVACLETNSAPLANRPTRSDVGPGHLQPDRSPFSLFFTDRRNHLKAGKTGGRKSAENLFSHESAFLRPAGLASGHRNRKRQVPLRMTYFDPMNMAMVVKLRSSIPAWSISVIQAAKQSCRNHPGKRTVSASCSKKQTRTACGPLSAVLPTCRSYKRQMGRYPCKPMNSI